MGGTPGTLVLAILDEFANDTRMSHSINQLALSTKKAYPNVHATVAGLLKENILEKKVIGHSHQCRLNLRNDTTLLYLSLLQTEKKRKWLARDREHREIIKKIDENCGKHNILLVWERNYDFLVITSTPCNKAEFVGRKITNITLSQFLSNHELQATVGKHTLIFGHALYASLIHQPMTEVLR